MSFNGIPPTVEIASSISAVEVIIRGSFFIFDANFQLKKLPNNYAIGEMLDWDAPTGGYLLQGCFSMGYNLAQSLNNS